MTFCCHAPRPLLRTLLLCGISVVMGLCVSHTAVAGSAPFEPWKTSQDPVAALWKRISTGSVKLDTSSPQVFLKQMLRELDVPVASQVLVFSKTSLQNALIGPLTPRAIYFSEEAYVGWVQGGMFELIGVDPVQGPQFYSLSFPYEAASPS